MGDSRTTGGEPSSSSYETADEIPGHTKTMETFVKSINTAVTAIGSLFDDFHAQIDEMKTSHKATLRDIDSIKAAQQQSSAAFDGLVVKVSQCEALAKNTDGLNDIRTQTTQLQGAVDAVLEQHKSVTAMLLVATPLTLDSVLTARVQVLSQGHALPNPAGPDVNHALVQSHHDQVEAHATRADPDEGMRVCTDAQSES